MRKILTTFVLGIMLITTAGIASAESEQTGIQVIGEANIEKTPDQTIIQFVIETTGKTPEIAQVENSKISSQVYQELIGQGIGREQFKTIQLSLDPQREYNKDGTNKVVGYKMTHQISLRLDGTDKAGSMVTSLIASGVTQIYSVKFGLKDEKLAQCEALAAAVKDAQSKAVALAEASGRRIIGVRAIEEQGINLRRPVGINYEMKSAADGAIQQQTWAGDITVTATIIVTYDF